MTVEQAQHVVRDGAQLPGIWHWNLFNVDGCKLVRGVFLWTGLGRRAGLQASLDQSFREIRHDEWRRPRVHLGEHGVA